MQHWRQQSAARQPVGSAAAEQLLVQTTNGAPATPSPRPDRVGVAAYTCLVFGTAGCGKTTLLEAFAGCKAPQPAASPAHTAICFLPSCNDAPAQVRAAAA